MKKARALKLGLLSGVLTFGAVVWYLRSSGGAPETTVNPTALLTVGRIVWGVAIVGCLLIFNRMRQLKTAAEQRTFSIIAWALSEGTALYGGIVFLLTGSALWYQLGLGFMVLAMLAFPGDPSP